MSQLTKISDALVEHLKAIPGLSGVVERKWLEENDNPELQSLRVSVIPRMLDSTLAARNANIKDFKVVVYIAKHIHNDGEGDAMMSLTEKIIDRIESKEWDAQAVGATYASIAMTFDDGQNLNERNLWRAILEVTYRLARGQQ